MYKYFDELRFQLIKFLEQQIINKVNEIRSLETELDDLKKGDWVENQINQIKINEDN